MEAIFIIILPLSEQCAVFPLSETFSSYLLMCSFITLLAEAGEIENEHGKVISQREREPAYARDVGANMMQRLHFVCPQRW